MLLGPGTLCTVPPRQRHKTGNAEPESTRNMFKDLLNQVTSWAGQSTHGILQNQTPIGMSGEKNVGPRKSNEIQTTNNQPSKHNKHNLYE